MTTITPKGPMATKLSPPTDGTRGPSVFPKPTAGAAAPTGEATSGSRRRVIAAVAALGAFVLAVVVFSAFAPRTPRSVPALVASRFVAAGHPIGAGDVRVVAIDAKGITVVRDRAQVIGKAAAVDIPAGALLIPADVGTTPGPGFGEALVGLAIHPGEAPMDLRVGDAVSVLATPRQQGLGATAPRPVPPGAPPASPVLAKGRVWSLAAGPPGAQVLTIDVIVASDASEAVALAEASDGVTVIRVAS